MSSYRRIVWWKWQEHYHTTAHLFPADGFAHEEDRLPLLPFALCGRPIPNICRGPEPGRRYRDVVPGEAPLCHQCAMAARAKGIER